MADTMDNIPADEYLSNNNSELEDELHDCTENKVCIYGTLISGGSIKQEPCDIEDMQASIRNYVNIKDEIIEESTVVIPETGFMTDTKESYLTCCDICGEKYDLYCLKCPMLIRIFNRNYPKSKDNKVKRTLPKNFIDIRETPSGVGIVALKSIPKGVVFGPFEGLDSTKDGTVSKWKLKNTELAYAKDPKRLNWMQYIRMADHNSDQNLTPFQCEDRLYYCSDCYIGVDNELLVCWNSGKDQSGVEHVKDSYWKPQVCARLDDTYACTLCCVGYKSICHLEAHNSRCLKKRNEKDFCKEIIQCAFCKIYLDQKEYFDYHINRCCESNPEKYVAAPRSLDDTDKPELKDKYKCSMCEYSTSRKDRLGEHQLTHTDLRMYKCPECSHRTSRRDSLLRHVRTHAKCNRNLYVCEHCSERFTRSDLFAMHQKKKHSIPVYKCDKCIFETMNARNLVRHQMTHDGAKPYRCNTCGKQFNSEKKLLRHVKNLHDERKKKYKCPKCDYETFRPGNMKKHLMNMHSGVKRFKCPSCPFETCSEEHLERHLRYHDDAKLIKCENCDIEFCSTQLLVRHKKEVHAITEKIYSCSKCEYRTDRFYVLKQHLVRVHDGPKHFVCSLCPYKTRLNSNLKRHIAIHNGDKPFACPFCPHRAMTNSNLKRHIATHNDDKPFACLLCSYKTATNSDLKRHVVTHKNDKPFKCDMCPQMFKHKSYLTKHVRKIHSQSQKIEYKCPQVFRAEMKNEHE